jgi:hypothetical protein
MPQAKTRTRQYLHIYNMEGRSVSHHPLTGIEGVSLLDRVQQVLRANGFGRALVSRQAVELRHETIGIFEWGPLGGIWIVDDVAAYPQQLAAYVATNTFKECVDGLAEAREMYGDSFITTTGRSPTPIVEA